MFSVLFLQRAKGVSILSDTTYKSRKRTLASYPSSIGWTRRESSLDENEAKGSTKWKPGRLHSPARTAPPGAQSVTEKDALFLRQEWGRAGDYISRGAKRHHSRCILACFLVVGVACQGDPRGGACLRLGNLAVYGAWHFQGKEVGEWLSYCNWK